MSGLAFVDAKTSVAPSTRSRVYSRGEFPRSKPLTFRPSRSPQRRRDLEPSVEASRAASSTDSTGMTLEAPFESATAIEVQLRRTSMMTIWRPSSDARSVSGGVK